MHTSIFSTVIYDTTILYETLYKIIILYETLCKIIMIPEIQTCKMKNGHIKPTRSYITTFQSSKPVFIE